MNNETLLAQVTGKARLWLEGNYDEETKKEVSIMLQNEDKRQLIDAFYRDLEFGTGGLRGIMGAGSNRMNIYTVGAATQGLSNYLLQEFADLEQIKVVIGHDCRNNSRKFAEISADIFTANGIKVFLFEDLRPTPEVSYAIRKLGCQSGIMLTASHNPKEYNGYKAYWEDGAQVLGPHDKNIIAEVNRISSIEEIKFKGNRELVEIIGKDMDKAFIDKVKSFVLSPQAIENQKELKIVYTPIHGTGIKLIPDALKAIGFTNVIHVPEQDVISGDFPTVISPNPEEPAALDLAIKRGIETGADIVLASDPDADRIGAAIRDEEGNFILVNGNQIMLILIYYLMARRREYGLLKGKEYIVKTIVTTELVKKIADKMGIEMFDCYTGFKWIADVIRKNEGTKKYIGGGEESYGFLADDFVRDKDSVSACALFAEVAAWARDNGKTLYQLLQDIYVEYGYSKEVGISLVRKGKEGADEIEAMMKNFRANPVKELAGSPVILSKDFVKLESVDYVKEEVTTLEMPTTSNVLQYFTEDGTKVSIRPSGTEPKIKFYIEAQSSPISSREEIPQAEARADEKIDAIKEFFGL
ncbi:MAG: phospho-sugar mutase [Petrimonas sp.]|mgnify:CR=1 FL=1|uniref:phospho-sugar mutase n=1 Tax=Petrimonas sp. TaxID=2023866 RepID=UPI000969103D|nr:phospho-sugar mutase [Petrimonas sp.]OJV35813.1 MAG: phosphoglucomutase [Bacteroidia bacterium 43-41]MEA4950027.1 phospho-sugar mutase [Petrimonas sp.]MEA4979118.1 phospho-sugar mutase [Petrimonas sp.]MEA5045022.1 phospho-sugar mutase [Petrimonas sp.]